MNGKDVRCPECGTINYSLYLEETDGWMECEHCGCSAHLLKAKTDDLTDAENCLWQVIRPLPSAQKKRLSMYSKALSG